ncbi:MAG: porphobilinogen synthase, partial [Candidatus Nitrosotenuis sp.]|nr:porphobilinogen synthase [Candidatus Nitrosotenuis sp.]
MSASFPTKRLRRLRKNEKMRNLVQEVLFSTNDLICPVFVQEDLKSKTVVESMPDIQRLPISDVTKEVDEIKKLNIPAIMLFGIPAKKDEHGSGAFVDDGIVQKAIRQVRESFGDGMVIMADVCLCQYTSSGHCGILRGNTIDNDTSLKTLSDIALSQARAGVDIVSP